jgi:predicted transcriptional regulator
MELHLTPETEARLNDLALRTHRGTDELLEEAVDHLIEWNKWAEKKIQDSIAAAERGEVVSNDEVREWMERRERA